MSTLDYYNKNAKDYAAFSLTADMSESYERFLKYIPKGASIADLGCGCGRDLKFFKDSGYDAYGFDGSVGLSAIAREYAQTQVDTVSFLTWQPNRKFDAFWANASLLHLPKDQIVQFFKEKTQYLKEGGVFYFSMKKGIPEGYDEVGRLYTLYSEDLLKQILKALPQAAILEKWTKKDSLNRGDTVWESVILRI